MKRNQLRGSICLLITAFIWGVAFVAQSVGMDYVGPFTFTCVRSIIAGIVLLPCIYFMKVMHLVDEPYRSRCDKKNSTKTLIRGGILCGCILCTATCFQQIGIMYTSVGKTGFITAFYIILVPVIGLFFKKKTGPFIWIGVMLALVGLYLLCITGDFTVQLGDGLVFICALFYAVHIMCVDYFTGKVNGIKMSCIQFWVGAMISGILMFLFETPDFTQIMAAWQPILYAGVLSSGVAYTLQIIGQRDMNPTIAALIMSLESVIAVLAGWWILGQSLSARELIGCVIMFIAIILAQLPEKSVSMESVNE